MYKGIGRKIKSKTYGRKQEINLYSDITLRDK